MVGFGVVTVVTVVATVVGVDVFSLLELSGVSIVVISSS